MSQLSRIVTVGSSGPRIAQFNAIVNSTFETAYAQALSRKPFRKFGHNPNIPNNTSEDLWHGSDRSLVEGDGGSQRDGRLRSVRGDLAPGSRLVSKEDGVTMGHGGTENDCEHDTRNGEQCCVAHSVNGIPQGQCTRCTKCGRWVEAPFVTEALLPSPRPASLLWLPDGSGRS